MTYLKDKVYPKIDWVKLYDADLIGQCIDGFNEDSDNILACYNGLVNSQMVGHLRRILDNSGYKNKILILSTCKQLERAFLENGFDSIFAHKDVIELKVQNFNIEDVAESLDFISISRESKRLRIEEFLERKWMSCTWDDVHYPTISKFEQVNSGFRSDCEISSMINLCKYGYFSTHDIWETNPPLKFWLCGKPTVLNVSNYDDGVGTFCTDSNHINLKCIQSVSDIDFNKKWNSEKIRLASYNNIQRVRQYVNDSITRFRMTDHLLLESIDDVKSLPKW